MRSSFAIAMSGIFILASCTTVTTQGFRATNNPNVEVSYVATDANFGKYNQLTAEDMGIFFPESAQLPSDDLRRIRQIFRGAFIAELKDYEIVDDTGPSTMMVQASLIDLRNASAGDVPNLRRELNSVARPGALVFLMELRDSETDRVLARAADSAANPRFGSGDSADWQGVEEAAQQWAALFRGFLDQNLNQ